MVTLLLLVTVASFILNGGLALAAAAATALAHGAGTLLLVAALLGVAAAAALGAQVLSTCAVNTTRRHDLCYNVFCLLLAAATAKFVSERVACWNVLGAGCQCAGR